MTFLFFPFKDSRIYFIFLMWVRTAMARLRLRLRRDREEAAMGDFNSCLSHFHQVSIHQVRASW